MKWQNPTAAAQGRPAKQEYEIIAQALRSRPGEWAIILEGTNSRMLAGMINHGNLKSFPDGEFRAVSRKSSTGIGFDIYASYIADPNWSDDPEWIS